MESQSLNDIPDGLGAMQYATRICEDLGIPSRSNVQMIGEAIEAVSKSRLFRGRDDAMKVSYYWLSRRVMTAKDQGAKINSLWFHSGEYWNVEKPEGPRKTRQTCGNCIEGWVRIFDGRTVGGYKVHPKIGALKRCQCWSSQCQ